MVSAFSVPNCVMFGNRTWKRGLAVASLDYNVFTISERKMLGKKTLATEEAEVTFGVNRDDY